MNKRTVFIAALATETNTFAPFATGLEDFDLCALQPYLDILHGCAEARGWRVVEGMAAMAEPAGKTTAAAYDHLKTQLLAQLQEAMPVDMVVLVLHGAMVAQNQDDCEGDILQAVRAMVGPEVPVGVGLDPHAHLTDTMTDNADILCFMKQWPHIDALEVASSAFNLTADYADGLIANPCMSVFDCRMIDSYYTLDDPVKSLVDDMKAAEQLDGILSTSLVMGFAPADVADMGTKILVITDDRTQLGDELAALFGRRLFAMRGQTMQPPLPLEEGLDTLATATRLQEQTPVVVADIADAASGGAPGDATYLLQGLLERGIEQAVITSLWDPMALAVAFKAGEGARVPLRIGGKTGPTSGEPIDLLVEVRCLRANALLVDAEGNDSEEGNIAVVRARGIDIVLRDKRASFMLHQPLQQLGIDLPSRKVLVVKSINNFRAGFEPVAGSFLYINSPGLDGCDITSRDYDNIERPKWPFDCHPFEELPQ